MSRLNRRLLLDLALTVMLVFEMFYSLTGNALHEFVGFALFVGVAVHLILSRKWIAHTIQAPKMTSRRRGLAIVATLLFVDVSLLVVSSLIISTTLAGLGLGLWRLNASGVWTIVHHASAYGLCAITTVHLAMHWTLFAKSMHVSYDPSRRQAIGYAVGTATALGILAIGHVGLAKTIDASEPDSANDDESQIEKPSQQKTEETPAQSAASEQPQEEVQEEDAPVEEEAQEETAYVEEEPQEETVYVEEEPQVTGNCPLCHNHCPLSSPGCSRPYRAGLI